MIKRLRLKFILTNMILITVVMLTAFAVIYVFTSKSLENSSIDAMHSIISEGYSRLDRLFYQGENIPERYSHLSAYVIEINEYTRTYTINGFTDSGTTLDESQKQYINSLINSVRLRDEDEGVLEEYNLRYCYVNTMVGKRIVLLDKGYEDDSLKRLILSFVIIGLAAAAAFLLISIAVAHIAVKPVERSLQQQRRLISDVSHELKTPLTVINTNADIILSHTGSTVEDESKWIGYIKDETTRMSDLVGNMLYLAKADEMTEPANIAEMDLSAAAYEASLPFESVLFENGKKFDISITDGISINADEKMIKQLIVILLDNANKYSNESGTVSLTVRSENDKAFVTVFNTGEPIPQDSIPHLFERFYRVDKSRSREQGGNGLGLSIAKHIIEQNEGSIAVTSSAESGTTFECSFKLAKKKNRGDRSRREDKIESELEKIQFD